MKSQSLPILLILMMLITPIASAFDHCVEMGMSGDLSPVSLSADDTMLLNMLGSSNYQADMDCHSSDSCTFHFCADLGVIATVPRINTLTSSYYSIFEYLSPYSTVLSSELRPPIVIL
jgi:hypothetical protein